MYLAIDIGGTKTLVATFDSSGNKVAEKKFETNPDYSIFLKDLENIVAEISTNKIIGCCIAIPGRINREAGIIYSLGNLGWKDKSIKADVLKILNDTTILIENDAKLAGLAEAQPLKEKYDNVVYITISTGIGVAEIRNGKIVEALKDLEMGKMPLKQDGAVMAWEDFASGRAIFEKYGQKASDITDEDIWREIGENIAYGTAIVCSALQPEVIVYGGGVGQYAEKFSPFIYSYLKESLHTNVSIPKEILPAHYKEESVIYGCFEILRQKGLVK